MIDSSRAPITALRRDEVRIYTLDSGESATVRSAALRILAMLLGIEASTVELYSSTKGKPMLRNDPSLHFSISHSRDVSMVAVTRVAPVGVDIEQLRAIPNAEAILKRFFSHKEINAILTDDRRDLRFIEAWTRAESRVKARGASVWEAATPDASTTVRQIHAPEGFAAAVAVASETWTVSQYNTSVADIVAE